MHMIPTAAYGCGAANQGRVFPMATSKSKLFGSTSHTSSTTELSAYKQRTDLIELMGFNWSYDPNYDLTQASDSNGRLRRIQIREVKHLAPAQNVEQFSAQMGEVVFPPMVMTLDHYVIVTVTLPPQPSGGARTSSTTLSSSTLNMRPPRRSASTSYGRSGRRSTSLAASAWATRSCVSRYRNVWRSTSSPTLSPACSGPSRRSSSRSGARRRRLLSLPRSA